jgi:hypothetical protein
MLLLLLPKLVAAQTIDAAGSVDAQFSNPSNLTDAKMDQAKNFVHQGQKERIYKEKCAQTGACKEQNQGFPVEMLIGKAYAVMGMFLGKELTKKPEAASSEDPPTQTPPPNPAQTQATKSSQPKADKGEGQRDYCMIAAMAWEGISTVIQKREQKNIQNIPQTPGDEQLQSLVMLRETHKAREKSAKIQGYAYGAVTGCYVAMLASGAAAMNNKLGIKMGGAALLTTLYLKKANKHKNAASKVDEVIATLEPAGKNCNPYTKTACFCTEPTSKDTYPTEFQEVCVLNKGNFETPKLALGCAAVGTDKKISYDKECKCKQSNSCLKSNLKPFNPKFEVGSNLIADTNKTLNLLANGDIDQGHLDRASLRNVAMASQLKSKMSHDIKAPTLTAEQKKIAKEFETFLPTGVAAAAAAATPSSRPGLMDSAIGGANVSKILPTLKEKLAEAIDGGYRTGGGETIYTKDDDMPQMPTIPGQEEARAESTEVLEFADKAISKADVSNAPSTPIFDIISNRYRRSGWAKLDAQEK